MGSETLEIDGLIAELEGRYSKTSVERLLAMANACKRIDAENIPGDIVECGVWRGGNIILARKLSPERVCWLYDTFEGMTEPGQFDTKLGGETAMSRYRKWEHKGVKWAAVSVEEVIQNLADTWTYDDEYLRFVKGPVEETLLDAANLPNRIALLRLDTDWYESTKIELEVLYPRLVIGGILIVDDYGHWMGARKAVDEYFGSTGARLEAIDYSAVQMVKR